MNSNPTLYLIPTPIGKRKENFVLPEHTIESVKKLTKFVVEKPQTTISFLKWIKHPTPEYQLTFRVLNKKTPEHEIYSFLQLFNDGNVGLMSEAGAPGVADPGALFVQLAHENGIKVVPLVGPSSILMALMASGMNGQSFAFHGYLSINENERIKEISRLEDESKRTKRTQIFMETPHRNRVLFEQLKKTLQPSTRLCIASNITQDDEFIQTKKVHDWNGEPNPDIEKKPCLFLIHAN
ncbi:MAG: SAM-dependent methyltransferase [Balneolaceae bacterium]|nr:SAM-dependent methyltransferase [Balneolaceae bacterium]